MPDHSFTRDCPTCHGPCDHSRYSRRYLAFVHAHAEAFQTAYLDGNPATSGNEMERLQTEYKLLPPRHTCSCYPAHCALCLKLSRQRTQQPSPVTIGRSSPINPPMPSTLSLDIAAGYV